MKISVTRLSPLSAARISSQAPGASKIWAAHPTWKEKTKFGAPRGVQYPLKAVVTNFLNTPKHGFLVKRKYTPFQLRVSACLAPRNLTINKPLWTNIINSRPIWRDSLWNMVPLFVTPRGHWPRHWHHWKVVYVRPLRAPFCIFALLPAVRPHPQLTQILVEAWTRGMDYIIWI